MDLIKFSLKKPVTIIVAVILIVMFGVLALTKLPYQLTPNVTEPEISVKTTWVGATPYEIEREIIEEQEKVLKSIVGLKEYESSSNDNVGSITLTFKLGVDLNEAMLKVSNKLNEVDRYPENVDKPVIKASGASSSPVIWTILETDEGNSADIDTYRTYFENSIKEHLERVEGVSELFVVGGRERELHIVLNQERLASYNLTIDSVIKSIQSENINVSAGVMNISRRAYRVRTTGEFKTPEDVENILLVSDSQNRIYLKDVANVIYGYHKKDNVAMIEGKNGIIIGFRPEAGANVVALTDRVEKKVKFLNEEILSKKALHIKWLHDQRPYILGSIDLVKQNIAIGGALAVIVLLIFLRSLSSTAIAAIAIPVSIIATFMILEAMGRSLNTISLAGISFAVGMLVDSAIVVLENIDRHRKMGKTFFNSAYDGTTEVWGALIASALTTIAVFLPIIFLEDEAGQLFKDIAIAVTASVSFSLFVSISVIPMLFTQFLKFSKSETTPERKRSTLVKLGDKFVDFIMFFVNLTLKNRVSRIFTITLLTGASIFSILTFFPKMEYLPQGNRNLVMNILIPPPGLSIEEKHQIGYKLFEDCMPYMNEDRDGVPAIGRMFFVTAEDFIIFGGKTVDGERVKELLPFFAPRVNQFPGVFGISKQAGVFESGIGEGRTVDVDIIGSNLEQVTNIGGMLFGAISKEVQNSQVRPVPSVELIYPEVRVIPDRDRLKSIGMSSSEFGEAIDVLMDGRVVSEFKAYGEKKIDILVKADDETISTPERLYMTQIALPSGDLLPISSLSSLDRTTGISSIRHLNGKRTVTLQVSPPESLSIQETMDILNKIIDRFRAKGALDGVDIKLAGTADKLLTTVEALSFNFFMAIAIIYLLMSALFGNFVYPIVILFTVPLATAGGFIGLKLTNMFIAPQPLDILTMLGFIILIGIVVNNAILIVHQSLNLIRFHSREHKEAIIEATKSRLRPIYMSSLTSIFGMLPLVLVPGPGAEFYRGLGSVITGGLAFSTIFTIFMTPALLMFFIKLEKIRAKNPY